MGVCATVHSVNENGEMKIGNFGSRRSVPSSWPFHCEGRGPTYCPLGVQVSDLLTPIELQAGSLELVIPGRVVGVYRVSRVM